MTQHRSSLFSIPPGARFLNCLADALISGELVGDIGWGHDPLRVADATIYLPTRRAARTFAGVLAARATGPAILPRIVPLGDADEAELRLVSEDALALDGDVIAGAPAAEATDRLIFLADLIMRWRSQLAMAITPLAATDHSLISASPTEAFALAGDLMRVIDLLTVEQVSTEALEQSVPGEHDRYWEISRTFLAIATRAWPAFLDHRGLADPIARRDRVLRARARQIAEGGGEGPFIAAGSTGTNPATAELISAIARHRRGAVVLPGLDQVSSGASFAVVADGENPPQSHPQAALARLLTKYLKTPRIAVQPLAAAPKRLLARERVLAQAMQPAAETTHWAAARRSEEAAQDIRDGLRGIGLIEADNDREEALAVALAMRRAVRRPGRTVALATPDRGLAERVCAALGRWGLDVEDSAGRALTRARRGSLAILAARWLASPADGALMTALLSHPGVLAGMPIEMMARAAATIDIGLLRGYPQAPDLATLIKMAPARRSMAQDWRSARPARRLSDGDWRAAEQALTRLAAIEGAFADQVGSRPRPIGSLVAAHRAALLALTTNAGGDARWLFADPDGEALRELLEALIARGEDRAPVTRVDYPSAIKALMDNITLSPPSRTHPRVAIWGLLEARLLSADCIILGGLNEGTWPPQPQPDAFLNRAMRKALGLPQPERRIGQTAHDFVSALAGARDVLMTRAGKSGGAPTIPSRFWKRLVAYVGDDDHAYKRAKKIGGTYLAWARQIDQPEKSAPIARPWPKPPQALIPRRLSVSRIETLVRDPYAIFAQAILELDGLPPIGARADAALRGTLIHDAVAEFARRVDPFAADALERLLAIGEDLFAGAGVDAERIMFWRPRFRRAARHFIAWEQERRPEIGGMDIEKSGALRLALADGSQFFLSARADRIERLKDGTIAIVDFKTGAPPSRPEVQRGLAPQLTLEAAMASDGAFDSSDRGRRVSQLVYVRMSGARSGAFATDLAQAAGKAEAVDPSATAPKHVAALLKRVNALIAGDIGFTSHEIPKFADSVGDYDHLARVAEWSRGGDEDE